MKATFYLIMIASSILVASTAFASEKQVVGWLEKARIFPGGYQLSAKIDTGADNSSLNVQDCVVFQREGAEWVRFVVIDDTGKQHKLERKLVRLARIKRHSAPRQERPVALLGICVGAVYREVEVNLVDRSEFKYPLLVGRSFMSGALTVDPSKTYSVEPACPGAPVE
jgi:hypothetical protein